MTTPELSLWLLAREDQQQRLAREVDALAPRHAGHRFEPHVTLQGDLRLDEAAARELLAEIARTTAPQRWAVDAVEGTEHYFRSLYLRLSGGAVFDGLRRLCAQRSGTEEGLSPYAHMSLAYGPTQGDAAALRSALAATWRAEPLVLDRIALARSGQAVAIADWRLLEVLPLRG